MMKLLLVSLVVLGAACALENAIECTSDADCPTGTCEALDGPHVCVEGCDPRRDDSCDSEAGYICRQTSYDSMEGICRYQPEGIGVQFDTCDSPAQCAGGFVCASGQCLLLCRDPGEVHSSENGPCACIDVSGVAYPLCVGS